MKYTVTKTLSYFDSKPIFSENFSVWRIIYRGKTQFTWWESRFSPTNNLENHSEIPKMWDAKYHDKVSFQIDFFHLLGTPIVNETRAIS